MEISSNVVLSWPPSEDWGLIILSTEVAAFLTSSKLSLALARVFLKSSATGSTCLSNLLEKPPKESRELMSLLLMDLTSSSSNLDSILLAALLMSLAVPLKSTSLRLVSTSFAAIHIFS